MKSGASALRAYLSTFLLVVASPDTTVAFVTVLVLINWRSKGIAPLLSDAFFQGKQRIVPHLQNGTRERGAMSDVCGSDWNARSRI
jgi:hypothetical protein